MASVTYSPVVVDLRVNVDAGTNVEVLDVAADSHSDAIICAVTLPASTLFTDTSNGVFEMWESADARGSLKGAVANGTGAKGQVTQAHPGLAAGIQSSLMGSLNAEEAPIFKGYPAAYHTQAGIGELALAYAAHNLFGHVAATAAITNDAAIKTYTEGTDSLSAALGASLVVEILDLSPGDATSIANAVIGQDAARARDEDNNEYSPDSARALRFVAGDKVYVAITMTGWSAGTAAVTPIAQAYTGGAFAPQPFFFEITLA
jgi:hypothetical protein